MKMMRRMLTIASAMKRPQMRESLRHSWSRGLIGGLRAKLINTTQHNPDSCNALLQGVEHLELVRVLPLKLERGWMNETVVKHDERQAQVRTCSSSLRYPKDTYDDWCCTL